MIKVKVRGWVPQSLGLAVPCFHCLIFLSSLPRCQLFPPNLKVDRRREDWARQRRYHHVSWKQDWSIWQETGEIMEIKVMLLVCLYKFCCLDACCQRTVSWQETGEIIEIKVMLLVCLYKYCCLDACCQKNCFIDFVYAPVYESQLFVCVMEVFIILIFFHWEFKDIIWKLSKSHPVIIINYEQLYICAPKIKWDSDFTSSYISTFTLFHVYINNVEHYPLTIVVNFHI